MAIYSNRIVVSVSKAGIGPWLRITNSQNIPTQTGLQVMWQVPINTLQARLPSLNSDLSNLRFVYNGQYIPAWLESINNGTATIWIKMPVSIPANSSITLNLYANPGLNFDGVYWGEAPQLSSTYGQYDNGASMFNFYDNFAGTSLNTNKWNLYWTAIINNGLLLNSTQAITVVSTLTFGISILDFYGYFTASPNVGYWDWQGWKPPSNSGNNGNAWFTHNGYNYYGYGYINSSDTPIITYTSTNAGSSPNYVFSIANDGNNAHYLLNYNVQSTTYAMGNATNYIQFNNGGNNSSSIVFIHWVRVRAYPPNGVMPTVELV